MMPAVLAPIGTGAGRRRMVTIGAASSWPSENPDRTGPPRRPLYCGCTMRRCTWLLKTLAQCEQRTLR
jgi:hypothetical protein